MLRSVRDTCVPLPDIVSGGFNAEIFTANLQQVVSDLAKGTSTTPYSDAGLFFARLTHPTAGMRQAVSRIARRLSGDAGEGAVTSLITGFGGGKTHTLIGMLHIANSGSTIGSEVRSVLGQIPLPEAGSVKTAVLIGDVLSVVLTGSDKRKVPGTLWREIARQIADVETISEVGHEIEGIASPGEGYFEKVVGTGPCLIMIDEIAQYTARLEAAYPGQGAGNVAAFLMSLFNYAKRTPGVCVVLTLASARDAFRQQTDHLIGLIRDASGAQDLTLETAQGIYDNVNDNVGSVVARDAQSITPVTPSEIAGVLARRLFLTIDPKASTECAEEYRLQRDRQRIVSDAVNPERMKDLYPFHPSLIDLLVNKLSAVSTFQGTRGVLRALALAVRAIWTSDIEMASIHAMHVDLTRQDIVDELIGRTNQNTLAIALSTDVGSMDPKQAVASILDRRNPHPAGAPYHAWVWRTVFLHSLPGRESGKLFGINEADAIVSCLMPQTRKSPEITVGQVTAALTDIVEQAYYLRNEEGVCFADNKPSINMILHQLEQNVVKVKESVQAVARGLVAQGVFSIVTDVNASDMVPDKAVPVVAIVDPYLDEILPDSIVYEASKGKARIHQNVVHILVPSTTRITKGGQDDFISREKALALRTEAEQAVRAREALSILRDKYAEYGLQKTDLKTLETRERSSSIVARERTAGLYRTLYYPNADGVVSKSVTFSGQEGGAGSVKAIVDALAVNNEVLNDDNAPKMAAHLRDVVFEGSDGIPTVREIAETFTRKRGWPLLLTQSALETVIRQNVASGHWAVFGEDGADRGRPDTFYDKDNLVPLVCDKLGSLHVVHYKEAVQRGWTKAAGITDDEILVAVREHLATVGTVGMDDLVRGVSSRLKDADVVRIDDVVKRSAAMGSLVLEHPVGSDSSSGPIVRTPAQPKRPVDGTVRRAQIKGRKFASFIEKAGGIRRIPSLFDKDMKSRIDNLVMTVELNGDGRMILQLDNIDPKKARELTEYFQVLSTLGKIDPDGDAEILIGDPVPGCSLVGRIWSAAT